METTEAVTHRCGPLDVEVHGGPPALDAKVAEALHLFDHRWSSSTRRVSVSLDVADAPTPVRPGYLSCVRMDVDAPAADVLVATTLVGAAATGHLGADRDEWTITAPAGAIAAETLEDVEDLVGLALTTGWRRAGFVPVHAAGVVGPDGSCALLCAPSGGGKSTMTAALVRRGWRTLGDDKLLAHVGDDGTAHVEALLHTFNLDPATRGWFPEVGDLDRLPTYSAWTNKRKVPVGSVWDDATAHEGVPSRVVSLHRSGPPGGCVAVPLPARDVLATLLRQTVIPTDTAVARSIVAVAAACSRQVVGLEVEVGVDAHGDPTTLDELERLLTT
jgi:hypothetical protein